jgi:NADH:ubiquinone oxidoreductase subunit D
MEEMRQSLSLIIDSLNRTTAGPIKTFTSKIIPSKNLMKNSMESTIAHFKAMASGMVIEKTEGYAATEAPKGEFGVFISSDEETRPERVKLRAPGFYHLQGIKSIGCGHLLADVVTLIVTMDIVFGEVDR